MSKLKGPYKSDTSIKWKLVTFVACSPCQQLQWFGGVSGGSARTHRHGRVPVQMCPTGRRTGHTELCTVFWTCFAFNHFPVFSNTDHSLHKCSTLLPMSPQRRIKCSLSLILTRPQYYLNSSMLRCSNSFARMSPHWRHGPCVFVDPGTIRVAGTP